MILGDNLRIALDSLLANPLRSILTLTGMAVGIGAVLYVVVLGQLTQQRINERLQSLGSNILLIRPGYSRMHGVRTAASVNTLKWDEARELLAESQVINTVVPTFSGSAAAEFKGISWSTRVTGTTPGYARINKEVLSEGRFFNDEELRRRARVCVLGATVRDKLFTGVEPVGQTIVLKGSRFTVVGVLTPKGESWSNPDDQIFAPLTTVQARLYGVDYLSGIMAGMQRAADFDEALFDIENTLRRSHRLADDAENDFQVRRQDLFLSTMRDTNRDIARFIILIALVSLLVGGFGIANVMLVAVTERIREIGVRRSVGAKKQHIMVQFLTEAMVLGLLGGAIGVVGGALFNRVQLGSGISVPWDWVGYSFGICAGIGAIAGLFPAVRAANRNVVEALHYE